MNKVELVRPVNEARAAIERARAEGVSLLEDKPADSSEIQEFRARYLSWEGKTSAILENFFHVSGFMTTSPKAEFSGTAVTLLDLKISSTTIPWGRLPEVLTDIQEKLRVLDAILDRLEVYQNGHGETRLSRLDLDAPIFLVHGHDLGRREVVRRFLTTVTDRDVVVLADQPNRGQDLLGKLLEHAQKAAFAVVLLTPDDEGGKIGSGERSSRARQNVVFELGMFVGILGRDRVAALNEPSIEIPTDFSGVAYIGIEGESWQIELARELKAAGIDVFLGRAL